MPLYFVINDDVDGVNRDLFAVATTPTEAVEMTLSYFNLGYGDFDMPFKVFFVPQPHVKGAVAWPEPYMVPV